MHWAEVLGFIAGAFAGYTFEKIWCEVEVENIPVLYEQARKERERRKIEVGRGSQMALTAQGNEQLIKLEREVL